MKGSSSVWQCILIPWQYWGSTCTHSSVTQKPWGADVTAVSVIALALLCPALVSLPLHFCFSPSFPSPLSHGHGFQYCSLVLKRIILWIIIVLLQWLAVTIFLLPLPAGRMPKGLPAQQQARRLLEGCCQHRPMGTQQHTLTSGSAASLPSAPFFVSFQKFSKIVLFDRSRYFASSWAPYVCFCSECTFQFSLSVGVNHFVHSWVSLGRLPLTAFTVLPSRTNHTTHVGKTVIAT